MPRFAAGHQPLMLGADSAVDLIVERRGGRLYCVGLSVKVMNDHVPMELFPDSPFGVVRSRTKSRALFYAEPGESPVRAAVTRTDIHAASLRASLVIPDLAATVPLSVINLEYSCAGAGRVPLVMLRRAEGVEHPNLSSPDMPECQVLLTPATPVAIYGTTENQEIGVWIAPAGGAAVRLTVEQIRHPGGGGAVVLACHPGDLRHGRLTMLIHRSSSRQLVAGRRSASFSASSLFVALYKPSSMRMLHWLICSMPAEETPLSVPPIMPPSYPLPNILAGDGTRIIPLVSGDAGEPRALVIFGEPPAVVVQAAVSAGFFAAVIVATGSDVYLRGLLVSLSETEVPVLHKGTPCIITVDAVTVTAVVVESAPQAFEQIVLAAVTDHLMPGDEEMTRLWRHSLTSRLPAIPLVADPGILAVCNIVNLHRGRFPASDDPGQSWSALTRDELWLVPWTGQPETRTELIVGITRRLVAEYLAITALLDLCDERPMEPAASGALTAEDIAFLRAQFNRAQNSFNETDEQRSARVDEFNAYRVRRQLNPAAIVREFAIYVYNTPEAELRSDDLRLVNPLVIALTSDSIDHEIMDLAVSQWSNYAARMSGMKPGSLVVGLAPPGVLAQAHEMQAMLRTRFYGLTVINRHVVVSLRRQLGAHLVSAVDPVVTQVLTCVRPDRVVAISQLLLDYLPHEGSLLGLEIPVVRLPLSEQPANDVRLAIASAMRPSLIHRDLRACILRPKVTSDDPVLGWAAAMAAAAAERLHGLGLTAALEPGEGTGKQELLSKVSMSPIVMFFGHAAASRNLAELDLGEMILTTDDIAQADWTGSLVTLIGCETAALDTDHGDLAAQFINGGARAVIGTTAKITVSVADYFFEVFFRRIMQGLPLDYAFFDSRRDTAVFETLVTGQRLPRDAAKSRIGETHTRRPGGYSAFSDFLDAAGTSWADVETHAIYAMTLCMSGGTGQRII